MKKLSFKIIVKNSKQKKGKSQKMQYKISEILSL